MFLTRLMTRSSLPWVGTRWPGSRLRQDLAACTGDGVTHAFMVGLGESYLAAFVLALGLSDVTSGLISSVPPLVGAALQLVAPWGVRKLGSARRWVGVCIALQASTFVPLALGALLGGLPTWLLFLCASLYWAAAYGSAGAWNTWVGEIFPQRLHARYFGQRSRAAQLSTLTGLLLGGALLARGEALGALRPTFSLLFILASASRFTSLRFVLAQGEPRQPPVARNLSPGALAVRFFQGTSGRFLGALLAFQVAAQIALPYLNPFMLNGLGLSQGEYMLMSSAAFMAKALSLPLLGRLASRVGAWSLLVGCALGLVALPGLWMLVDGAFGMLPLQWASGVLLGGYELATLLLMLSAISSEERTQMLTLYNLLNALAMAGGSLIGAGLLGATPDRASYGHVFLLSTLARLAVVGLFFFALGRAVEPSRGRPGTTP